jgi:hypothetical protein
MCINEQKILAFKEDIHMLKYVAEELVVDYWGQAESEEVIHRLKKLFVLEVSF